MPLDTKPERLIMRAVIPAVEAISTPGDTQGMLNAVYAPLTGSPSSEQGRRLVARLRTAIEGHEQQQKLKKYTRKKTGAQFERAIGAFIADLLFAQSNTSARGWMKCSLRPESFDNGSVTRTQAAAVVAGLTALKLMEHVKGYAQFNLFDGKTHIAPKLRATAELLAVCADCGVDAALAKEHFARGGSKDLVVVRAASKEGKRSRAKKPKGKTLKIEIPPELREEMQELNSFLDGFTLEGGTCSGLYRLYHSGDAADFAFTSGGRLQAAGEDSYQNLPSRNRLEMRINGEPVAEIDVRASHLTILYALHHQNFIGDPYVVPGIGAEARVAVKAFITSTIGNGAPLARWSQQQSAKFKASMGEKLQERWPFIKIADAVIEHHPVLLKMGTPVDGSVRGWPYITWIESQAILKTMLNLKRVYGIPSYPVHDSLIVPRSKVDQTGKQLQAHYLGELLTLYKTPTPPTLRISNAQS